MACQNTHVQVVGMGASALSLLVAADNAGKLSCLLDAGIMFVEKSASLQEIAEGMRYPITSNSYGRDFIGSIGMGGCFQPALASHPCQLLSRHRSTFFPLIEGREFILELARIAENLPGTSIQLDRKVQRIEVTPDGIHTIDTKGQLIGRSKFAVIAAGGVEKAADRYYIAGKQPRVFKSGALLADNCQPLKSLLPADQTAELVVIGGAHSGFSVICSLMPLIEGKRIKVTLVHRDQIYFFAHSPEEYHARLGRHPSPEMVCGETGFINRFKGLRGECAEIALRILNSGHESVRLLEAADTQQTEQAIKTADFIVTAVGYNLPDIHIDDQINDEVFSLRNARVNGTRQLAGPSRNYPNIFGIGLGFSCNEQRRTGFNIYVRQDAPPIIGQIISDDTA